MTIKSLYTLLLVSLFALCFFSCNQSQDNSGETEVSEESPGNEPPATTIESPRKTASGSVWDVQVTVDYGSPAVKGREVWGGLEPYGKVWRAGANETTSIELSEAVIINNVKVEKGKYGFYLIPNEQGPWVAILNTDWNRDEHGAWGAYNYNKENDVVRVEITPEWQTEIKERLEYEVKTDGILLIWEKVNIKIPLTPSV